MAAYTTYILSSEVDGLDEAARVDRHDRLEYLIRVLPGARPVAVLGSWMGKTERSYAVRIPRVDAYAAADLLAIAGYFGQESVLEISPSGAARLLWCAGGRQDTPLGYLREISATEAAVTAGWTFIPSTGKYYTAGAGEEAVGHFGLLTAVG